MSSSNNNSLSTISSKTFILTATLTSAHLRRIGVLPLKRQESSPTASLSSSYVSYQQVPELNEFEQDQRRFESSPVSAMPTAIIYGQAVFLFCNTRQTDPAAKRMVVGILHNPKL